MQPLRVLVVEDDEDDFLIVRDLLLDIGSDRFTVEWCPRFERGLERLLAGGAEVCLLDFRLGAQTGLDLLREARSRQCETPIILLTGVGDQEVDLEAMHAGASDYLIKSELTASLLERAIRYAIQHQQAENERIRLVREQEARHQAEAASRAKDEFLAMVSHELRTPLGAILSWVNLLASGTLDPETQQRAFGVIERNARVQAQIIDDLLDIARIVNRNLHIEEQSVDLSQVVEKGIESIQPQAAAKSIQLLWERDHSLLVSGDPARLLQVVSNLLSNAVKFTPEGGWIKVALRGDGETAHLRVEDSGRGISADFLPHIFERFRQGRAGDGSRQGGLGLGLAIVRHLVEQQGGTIRAESPGEGHGAAFTIDLPLRAPVEA